MRIFDSHAHYLSEAFDDDRDTVLESLLGGSVCGIVEAGTSITSSEEAVALAKRWPGVYAAVGIHPEEALTVTESDLTALRQLCRREKVVAVGEIGLDYHYEDACPKDLQQQWFRRQLELANELSLPVVIHDREAHEDTLSLLKAYRPSGVLHCFSGSAEMAQEILKLGLYIGIGGVVTFKNARKLVEVAAMLPDDRMLLETDAPYLAPVPLRGHRCDSDMIRHTAAAVAAIRGTTTEAVLTLAEQNARRLFRI